MTPTARERVLDEILDVMSVQPSGPAVRVLRHRPGGAVSLVHLHVLALLGQGGAQPMRSLAEALGVSSASATGIVDRMEERGLVVRLRVDEDRRVVRVDITEAGQEVMRNLFVERRSALREMLDSLSEDELATLLQGARVFRRAHDRRMAAMAAEDTAE